MSNIGDLKKKLGGTYGLSNTPDVVNQALDVNVQFSKAAADGAAATATADTLIYTNPYDFNLVVVGGKIVGNGAGITADAANFATITIKTDNGAGGATAIALTAATTVADLGTLVSLVPKAFTAVTAANTILAPGANLFFNIAKSGTGVVVPISNYVIRLQKGE